MNNNQIDVRAVSFLNIVITENEYLMPLIQYNDKTPVWDGDVFLYKDNLHTKNWVRRIPVQVKRTTQKEYKLSDSKISFRVSKSDLKSFSADGGVIYFVVVMHGDKHKIFYKMLLPQDIQPLLRSAQFNKAGETKIEFNEFPKLSIEILKIFYLFVENRRDNTTIRSFKDLDLSQVAGFHFNTTNSVDFNNYASIAKAINSSSTYMYVIPKYSMDLHIPLEKENDYTVFVGSNRMIDDYIFSSSLSDGNNTEIFYIGSNHDFSLRSIKMVLNKTTSRIDFDIKPIGTLTQNIYDLNWLLNDDLAQKVIRLPAEKRKEFEEYKNRVIRIKSTLTKCGITEDIDISKLTDNEREELEFLYYSVTESQSISESEDYLFGRFNFSKYKILLYKRPDRPDYTKFIWSNPFTENDKFVVTSKNDDTESEHKDEALTSIFMIAQRDVYAKFANTDYNNVFEFLTSTEINDTVLGLLLQEQWHMISAFDDDNTNTEVLELALRFGKWIYDNTDLDKDYVYINTLQILKRQGKLVSSSDYLKLLELSKNDNNELRFASFTLLGERDNALDSFNFLVPAVQELYKTTPIYNLFTQLEQQEQRVTV
jgi:hypothetical protein